MTVIILFIWHVKIQNVTAKTALTISVLVMELKNVLALLNQEVVAVTTD